MPTVRVQSWSTDASHTAHVTSRPPVANREPVLAHRASSLRAGVSLDAARFLIADPAAITEQLRLFVEELSGERRRDDGAEIASWKNSVPAIESARLTVFLIDDRQIILPADITGHPEITESAASVCPRDAVVLDLLGNKRCSSGAYINWLDAALGIPTAPRPHVPSAYPFDIVDSPHDLESRLRLCGGTWRTVAGLCWSHSDPAESGELLDNVRIPEFDFQPPWSGDHKKLCGARLYPPALCWPTERDWQCHVGNIYTAQSFEFDYVGVIFGEDLVVREGMWEAELDHHPRTDVRFYARGAWSRPARTRDCLQNSYRVLLTRGRKGCFVFFQDAETRCHFRAATGGRQPAHMTATPLWPARRWPVHPLGRSLTFSLIAMGRASVRPPLSRFVAGRKPQVKERTGHPLQTLAICRWVASSAGGPVKYLKQVDPTPEQVKIIEGPVYGLAIVRGAAGSGKTTSAALRLRKVIAGVAADREASGDDSPIRVLVLTFNRTLKGYIEQLALAEAKASKGTSKIKGKLTVDTFAGWARSLVGKLKVIDMSTRTDVLGAYWSKYATPAINGAFVAAEVDYALGRFGRDGLDDYLVKERVGRGAPTLQKATRQAIIDRVIEPYFKYLGAQNLVDWNDLADQVLALGQSPDYDIVIADEVQDFSAQQIRAIFARVKKQSSTTFVIDAAQSLYPRGIDWSEIEVVGKTRRYRLEINYRNTVQIARFAQPLLSGLKISADGTLPDWKNCRNKEIGRTPELIVGKFSEQMDYAIDYIKNSGEVDPDEDSVGFLLLRGGGVLSYTKTALKVAKIKACNLWRQKTWPPGDENVAYTTLHSAKGLEFDHVFILGFNGDWLSHGKNADDDDYQQLRRLLAMAITRAKKTVFIGYKPGQRSDLLDLFDPVTYIEVPLPVETAA
jgi:Uncharacterized conserved protein (DUF2075)/UvrD-like helicase C-terminal domain